MAGEQQGIVGAGGVGFPPGLYLGGVGEALAAAQPACRVAPLLAADPGGYRFELGGGGGEL